ncbi:hypothetical protein V7S43_016662 [Phytophthora oleae]|uniref:Uncharacterized protein n=1 Tax=Phytophthora oleae TaxID=2107226 RepID=A0ABD3EUS1_9STRA
MMPLSHITASVNRFHRTERQALYDPLLLDWALFNFLAPRREGITVYGPSVRMQQEEGLYSIYAQLYFGGASLKLVTAGSMGQLQRSHVATTERRCSLVTSPEASPIIAHPVSASGAVPYTNGV